MAHLGLMWGLHNGRELGKAIEDAGALEGCTMLQKRTCKVCRAQSVFWRLN